MAYYTPVVDDDYSADPASSLVKKEGHVILVLAVEIFLVVKRVVFEAFDQESVVDYGDAQHRAVFGLVGDGEHRLVLSEETRHGKFGERGSEHGARGAAGERRCLRRALGVLRVDVDVNLAALGEPGAVGELSVVAEGIVVVEPAVAVGDGEFEVFGKHGLAREVLEHYADCVGVFLQIEGDMVWLRGRGIGKLYVLEAVEEGLEVLPGLACGIATEAAVEVTDGGFADFAVGYVEVLRVVAAPHEEVVASGSHLDGELMVGGELGAVDVETPDERAGGGVEGEERNAVDFITEGVGKFHIVVVGEPDEVVAVDAVAVLKD